MEDRYFYPFPGGRWTTSLSIKDERIALVQDSSLDKGVEPERILLFLGIVPDEESLDLYFPVRPGRGRCPTLDLFELAAPNAKHRTAKTEIGV